MNTRRQPTSNAREVTGVELVAEGNHRWRIDRHGAMRVPGVVFASRPAAPQSTAIDALEQVCNVATLPGIVEASYAMPDIHWGYGFPIGGVAATDVGRRRGVSPGGVGFDISCGVRLLVSDLDRRRTCSRPRTSLMDELGRGIPRGMGRGHVALARRASARSRCCEAGPHTPSSRASVRHADLEPLRAGRSRSLSVTTPGATSAIGRLHVACNKWGRWGRATTSWRSRWSTRCSSRRSRTRSVSHSDQVVVMIHSGSRGLGHQICTDHVAAMDDAMDRYGIEVPDRQLACVPVELTRRAGVSQRHEQRRELRAGQPPGPDPRDPKGVRAALGDAGSSSSTTSPTTWPDSRSTTSTVADAGSVCTARAPRVRFPPGHPDLPPELRGCGPAGAGAGFDGHRQLRARRVRRIGRLPLGVPRRRAHDEPPRGQEADPTGRRSRPSSRTGASPCAAHRVGASPRRHRSPTRTWRMWSRPASRPDWRCGLPGFDPWAWSKGEVDLAMCPSEVDDDATRPPAVALVNVETGERDGLRDRTDLCRRRQGYHIHRTAALSVGCRVDVDPNRHQTLGIHDVDDLLEQARPTAAAGRGHRCGTDAPVPERRRRPRRTPRATRCTPRRSTSRDPAPTPRGLCRRCAAPIGALAQNAFPNS